MKPTTKVGLYHTCLVVIALIAKGCCANHYSTFSEETWNKFLTDTHLDHSRGFDCSVSIPSSSDFVVEGPMNRYDLSHPEWAYEEVEKDIKCSFKNCIQEADKHIKLADPSQKGLIGINPIQETEKHISSIVLFPKDLTEINSLSWETTRQLDDPITCYC